MSRWQDCVFDLYGTLADIHTEEHDPSLWEAMSGWYTRYGARYEPAALHDLYFRLVRELEQEAAAAEQEKADVYPEIRLEPVFRRLFAARGIQADPELICATGAFFRKGSLHYIRLYPGAKELLHALRASQKRVWLLTNAQRLFTMPEIRFLGLEKFFDGIYLSSDYGFKKPDRRFFQQLLAENHIQPEKAVMIGNDGLCDIQGAQAVGLSTIYIRSNISPEEPLPQADYVLENMDLFRVRDILLVKGEGPETHPA